MPKRSRADDSSSSMDSEARRLQQVKRARRRKEHELRTQKAKERNAAEREALRLALMTPEERRQHERDASAAKLDAEAQQRRTKVERLQRLKAKMRNADEQAEEERVAAAQRTKQWTLDSESEAAEDEQPAGGPADDDDVDPLDAYMSTLSTGLPRETAADRNTIAADELRTMRWQRGQAAAEEGEEEEDGADAAQAFIDALKQIDAGDQSQAELRAREQEQRQQEEKDKLMLSLHESSKAKDDMVLDIDDREFDERTSKRVAPVEKVKDLKVVDHSKISYPAFRKDFYVPCGAIKSMTADEVKDRRKELDKIKVKAADPGSVVGPVERWEQCGLTDSVLRVLSEAKMELPFPIQAQAIPVIMSGRDVVGCARTGTGKTLAYVLPMLRHILDQPPLRDGDGPIAMVLVPTRELAQQVLRETNRFSDILYLRFSAAYGGVPVADQIAEARRGVHGLIATPGRLIDLMVANKGRVVPTNRTTFVVLDEADRMLDDGLGPQMAKIVNNVRPDRQMVMFSATVPKMIEVAARKFMTDPVQVIVGGRRNPSTNVTQHVDCFETDEHRWLRLLQLLGEWYHKGLVLIFTETQAEVDQLWEDLFAHGYDKHCISLHAGMDQVDRDLALYDFNTREGSKRILIATSVAARGIDVPDIELVINYRCPSHLEDYIHRVGRTGRANKRGVAWTFYMIGEDEQHATWLVRALHDSNNQPPEQLQQIANEFWQKRKKGLVPYFRPNRGYNGRGYRFDLRETRLRREEQKARMRAHGLVDDSDDDDAFSEGDGYVKVDIGPRSANVTAPGSGQLVIRESQRIEQALAYIKVLDSSIRERQELAAQNKFSAEIEINDYPQVARWRVTNRDSCAEIIEQYEATVMTKGIYCKRNPPPGERKLYLQIDGKDEEQVQGAKKAILALLEEETQKALAAGSALGVGRPLRSDGRPGKIGGPRLF